MADFNSIEDTSSNGEQVEVVEPQDNSIDDFRIVDDEQAGAVDLQDEDSTGESAAEADSGSANQKQTREDNQAARMARLAAERESKRKIEEATAAAKNELNARILASGAINPYTNKPFASIEELEEYGKKVKDAELKEKSRKTGKTIEELTQEEEDAAYIRQKRHEDAEAAKKNAEKQAQSDFFRNDLISFVEKYPDVDVETLDNNPNFRKFCGSRYGKEPLTILYEDFTSLVGNAKAAAIAKNADHRDRSTGSGQTGGIVLTTEQREALDKWNKENPDMAMTPKEFLQR